MTTISLPVRRSGDAPRVLVIDDDEAIRSLAEQMLIEAGFSVVTADDGASGLTLFLSISPDLVLVDLEMPGMDGCETCRQIRAASGGEHIPVIIMTGTEQPERVANAFEAGATDLVPKPFKFQILMHRLRYMLRASTAANALRDSERRLGTAQRIAKLGHWEWAVGFEDVELSMEAKRILGVDEEEMMTLDWLLTIVHPDDRTRVISALDSAVERREPFRVEHRIRNGEEGEERIVYQEGEVGREETSGMLRVIATIQDITDRKHAEWRIAHLTNHDATTGLPNQRLITEQLSTAIAIAQLDGTSIGIIAIDPDQFKRVNESLGHRNGDALLRAYAGRLDTSLAARPPNRRLSRNLLGRSGAVGFVAVLPGVDGPDDLERIAKEIAADLSLPFEIDDNRVYVSSSFGLAIFPEDGRDASSMLEVAGVALSEAKDAGRGSISFHDKTDPTHRSERFVIEARLRTALENDALSLVYQPKVRTVDHQVVGVEALLRWNDPKLGFVSPAVFIPIAEECGLIASIDSWVLEHACQQAMRWSADGFEALAISVNVSAEQFGQPGFVDFVLETLKTTGLPANQLELELTERTLMKDSAGSIGILQAFRTRGIRVAIDDFGTGYSSLSYLTRFPVDTLKIDRSFIVDVHEHHDRAAIVCAIIAMSKSLDIRVVAEGVETQRELEFLAEQHCDEIQGYLFAKPMPSNAFLQWRGARQAG